MNIDNEEEDQPQKTINSTNSIQDGDTPKFDVSVWPEKIPLNLHYTSDYVQNKLLGKVKPSTSHRQVRLKNFKVGIRRNPKDERKMMSAANKNDYPLGMGWTRRVEAIFLRPDALPDVNPYLFPSKGAPSSSSGRNRDAFHHATLHQESLSSISFVLKFLESGIDARSADEKKRTALHFAAAQGNVLIAQMLIERGADPNQIDILNNTPLHLAVCTNNIAMVTLLLKAGTNPKAIQQCGRRLLLLAKSTLCMMPKNTDFNCEKHKQDALQLTEMLLQYLCRTGWESDVKQLENLRNLLHKPSCNDLDNVNDLLNEFTSLAIDRPIT